MTTTLPVEFVTEMTPIPGNEGERPITEPAEAISRAREALAPQIPELQASLVASATPEKLAEISRYAKYKTIPRLPDNWLSTVQLHPLSFDDGNNVIIFGNKTKDGFNLPSHAPGIVFRKLVVRVYVSPERKELIKAVVSIRGWCEE